MANNFIIRRLARRWPTLLVLLLLALAIFFGIRYLLGADRRAFIEKLRVGYENDIVLLPVYANLSDPQCYQALILKGIQPGSGDFRSCLARSAGEAAGRSGLAEPHGNELGQRGGLRRMAGNQLRRASLAKGGAPSVEMAGSFPGHNHPADGDLAAGIAAIHAVQRLQQ